MTADASRQGEFFIPAVTTDEAITRIYGLTGAYARGRGEKRALVALRDSLDLDIDLERTNAEAARLIASALDVEWAPARYEIRNKVRLSGLNVLLEGATHAFLDGRAKRVKRHSHSALETAAWAAFEQAVSKIEAVNRISALTDSGPEWLGPGSKEHKRVLVNLVEGLHLPVDTSVSKTRLAQQIAESLGAPWTDTCVSTGYTISLEGLNYVLAGAERHLGRLGSTSHFNSARSEADALVGALADGLDGTAWDGRSCVTWLRDSGHGGQNQTEWPGFFFEARGRDILNRAFTPRLPGPRVKYGNTVFDYALDRVWDLKALTAEADTVAGGIQRRRDSMLNDQQAINECVAEQGLGFIVLSGRGKMDHDGSFAAWHRDFKEKQGLDSARSNSGRSRLRKAGFAPLHLDAFWIPDAATLDASIAAGVLRGAAIGRQAPRGDETSGAARRPKYTLVHPAESLRIATHEW
ncbi:hypothetical protein [Demequina sp. NBRC 110051]|uniref:hypothetical protein n=1 Tax=Demequina sp. NBRC 110051 TaxID=1570340 RepID=UPI000A05BB1F|nr:hypothetical protein [Demequina sp. NBRC 110051]